MGDKTLPLFDKSYAYDLKRWNAVWDETGLIAGEAKRDEQSVRDFFYFKSRDPKTGEVSPSYAGYFKRDTEYARLHTEQRVAMISGNQRELDQWVFMFIYDLYSIATELVKDDPKSLYKQLPKIRAPIFLAFGAREPFIPGTPLNGLTDLANDIINPFVRRMSAAGNPPVLKVYPNVGHFIHTDVPYEFARDTVDFMKHGRVNALSPEAVYVLVNGAADGDEGGGGAGKPTGLAK
jgi:pimeloyl-ACP methyl ester carboxylesterase